MNQTSGATHNARGKLCLSCSPEDFLIELHQRVSEMSGGRVADYIPELGKADPATFGIALATVEGEIYATGHAEHRFTIQSVSKPFMYGYTLQHYGRDYVLRHVGVEPTEKPSIRSYSMRSPRGAVLRLDAIAAHRRAQ